MGLEHGDVPEWHADGTDGPGSLGNEYITFVNTTIVCFYIITLSHSLCMINPVSPTSFTHFTEKASA